MITRLEKMRIWCQKVLPLVYDDSLSYYEVLCKLKDTMNTMIENQMEMADNLDELNRTVVKTIQFNGVDLDTIDNKVTLPPVTTTVMLNSEARAVSEQGVIELPNLAETISVSGSLVGVNADGIAELPNLAKNINVNGALHSADSVGIIDLPNMAHSVSVDGSEIVADNTGNVALPNLAKTVTVNGNTIQTQNNGTVALPNVVENITINGNTTSVSATGNISKSGLAERVVVNNGTHTANNSGTVTLPNLASKLVVDGLEHTPDSNGVVTFNSSTSAGVNSFNSRQGNVVPADGDYNAGQIVFNNSGTDLQATRVQGALTELNNKIETHTSGVTSFNSRTGAVVPANNDYSAAQISYDGSVIGSTDTNVSGAITTINNRISQAGGGTVTSVNATGGNNIEVSGGPITSSGTLAIGVASGYAIPASAKQTQWDSAYTDTNNATDQATPYAIAKRNSSGDIIVNGVYGKLYGTANRAISDQYGNAIDATYLKTTDTIRIVASATAPADTSVIWIDTSETT